MAVTQKVQGIIALDQVVVAPSLAVDHSWSGEAVRKTVDANAVGLYALLFIAADGNLEVADADAAVTMPCRYLALEAGTGAGKLVLRRGFVRDDTWTWTPGGTLYVSDGGVLTQTPPGTGKQVQPVGWAETEDVAYFRPPLVFWEMA